MTVNITSASLDNVEFKAIPLLSDGTSLSITIAKKTKIT